MKIMIKLPTANRIVWFQANLPILKQLLDLLLGMVLTAVFHPTMKEIWIQKISKYN